MAALLYLPRLYIYHIKSPIGSIQSETFKIMERRLTKVIMLPGMIVTFLSGVLMIFMNPLLINSLSINLKLVFVLLLSAVHGKFISVRKKLENDEREFTDFQLRVWNEVPTCIMIIIVILIVIRPF